MAPLESKFVSDDNRDKYPDDQHRLVDRDSRVLRVHTHVFDVQFHKIDVLIETASLFIMFRNSMFDPILSVKIISTRQSTYEL